MRCKHWLGLLRVLVPDPRIGIFQNEDSWVDLVPPPLCSVRHMHRNLDFLRVSPQCNRLVISTKAFCTAKCLCSAHFLPESKITHWEQVSLHIKMSSFVGMWKGKVTRGMESLVSWGWPKLTIVCRLVLYHPVTDCGYTFCCLATAAGASCTFSC